MSIENAAPINLAEKLAQFSEHWSPRVIAELNDYQLKLVKFEGEFVWHRHEETDELFLVINGEMQIGLKGSPRESEAGLSGDREVTVKAGELYVIPKGVEHITRASEECQALLIEPRGVVNTGNSGGDLTAPDDQWV